MGTPMKSNVHVIINLALKIDYLTIFWVEPIGLPPSRPMQARMYYARQRGPR